MTVTCHLQEKSQEAPLNNLADDVFDKDLDRALTSEFMNDERHHLAAAFDGEKVVGKASAVHYVHPDEPPQLFINEVGVSPAYRGGGIASRLLDLLLEQGVRLGCSEGWVLADPDNLPANALYRSAGGQPAESVQIMYTFDFTDPATRSA